MTMAIFEDQTTGNVGIGTQAPVATLDVRQSAATGRPCLHIETDAIFGGVAVPEPPSGAIVDIELTARSRQVQANPGLANLLTQGTAHIRVDADHSQSQEQRRLSLVTVEADMPITFETNGVERMRLNNTGLGIGTNMPQGALHILTPGEPPDGLDEPQNGLLLGTQGTAGFKWLQSYGGPLSLNPTGNGVGIGTKTPRATLDVRGTIAVTDGGGMRLFHPVRPEGPAHVELTANEPATGGGLVNITDAVATRPLHSTVTTRRLEVRSTKAKL